MNTKSLRRATVAITGLVSALVFSMFLAGSSKRDAGLGVAGLRSRGPPLRRIQRDRLIPVKELNSRIGSKLAVLISWSEGRPPREDRSCSGCIRSHCFPGRLVELPLSDSIP